MRFFGLLLMCLGLLCITSCAGFREAVSEWIAGGGVEQAVDTVAAVLPFPWNLVLYGAGSILGLTGAEATRRSVKNSPENKIFGPIRKPKETA